MSDPKPAHKRILLKLSGEALMGDDQFGINRDTIVRMVNEVAEVTRMGVEVAVVIGGGNIFRGVAGGSVGMDRSTADYMGMLATVMNALALGDTMNKAGLTARVMSAISIEQVVDRWRQHQSVVPVEALDVRAVAPRFAVTCPQVFRAINSGDAAARFDFRDSATE